MEREERIWKTQVTVTEIKEVLVIKVLGNASSLGNAFSFRNIYCMKIIMQTFNVL